MKIPFSFGGGGDSSDDCTAEAADVLEGKTAIYNGSDDDAIVGTMKDYSGTSNQATGSMNSSSSRVEYTVPNTGKYDTASKLYVPYSTLRTLIGYTDASKVLTGTTICGLAGTMTDKSGTSTAATSSTSGSNVRLQIPTNAYYNTSAYLTNSYSNMASTISLTAAKIASGNTILGIAGTARVYAYTSGSFTMTTSGHSTSTWQINNGSSVSVRSFVLSDFSSSSLSFTPQFMVVFGADRTGWYTTSGCNLVNQSSYSGYYTASENSNYKLTSSAITVPFYISNGNTAYWWIIGYN